ncbi:uncharacterized protein LOC113361748 [Papaver somniferum]|uniref:uncharacterized protein LOC113361748 n=1 Tax=Papaver somniferum TaxID=3469 RepID=UPI000E6FDAF1|nr:uncharacterized protein LOC113361748 [Papaver somniferum]
MYQILGIKYFKEGGLLHQNTSTKNCSYTWIGITKGIEVLKQNYFMEINNGKKTKIWKDKWIPGMNHPPSPINDLYRFYEDVAELYLSESNKWNISLLNRLFDADTSLKIQLLFIDCSKEDVMLWMPSKYGTFSVKSTYKMLTHSTSEVQVNGANINSVIWKTLWKTQAASRVKLFIWKCIRGINSTKSRRAQYNSEVETHYDTCGHGYEDMEHIIFACKHARVVWRGRNVNIDAVRENCSSVAEWVISWFFTSNSDQDQSWLITLMVGMWVLWKDRCEVFFQGVSLNPHNTVHKIHYRIASHMHCINPSQLPLTTSSIKISNWKPPINDVVKFNVDGSYIQDSNSFGTGIVLRNHTGACLGIKGSYGDGVLTPEEVECMACSQRSTLFGQRLEVLKNPVEADAKLVIDTINGNILLIQ